MEPIVLSELARRKLQNFNQVKLDLSEGHQGQEQLGFTNEEMALKYATALKFFQDKAYTDAASAFLFLAFLNHENSDYWLGLGMSLQMCHDYEAAIDAYELSAVYDLENPVSYFYLAKCLFAIHDRTSSLEALDLAIELSEGKDEYTELLQQAVHAKEVLFHAVK